MNGKTKFYYRVERRPRPESHRQRADLAEEENQALRERNAELERRVENRALRERAAEPESREENRALRERNAELERQLEELRSRRRRRRRNNLPRE